MRGLKGKAALVTGGAQGIGKAITERLLHEGVLVTFCDIDTARGQRVSEELGDRCLFVDADVTNEDDVARAVELAQRTDGGLDMLVNNAGVNAHFSAETMTQLDWESFMDVDLKSSWLFTKYAIPLMRMRSGGSIVNVASIHSFQTRPGMFPYAAAKAGLIGMTKSLAIDYGPENIRVNAVCPGYIRTRLVEDWLDSVPDRATTEHQVSAAHPLRRLGQPDDVAGGVAYLLSDDAEFITGTAMLIDGGLSATF